MCNRPLILTLALICSLLSGSAEHNNSAVLLCFHGGSIPDKTPAEYVAYIEDMRRSFTLLDDAIDAVNDMAEDSDSLDGIRVKAVRGAGVGRMRSADSGLSGRMAAGGADPPESGSFGAAEAGRRG